MEYLTIKGAVQLKRDVDPQTVQGIVDAILATEFIDSGHVDIDLTRGQLAIDAQGTVSGSSDLETQLNKLESYVTAQSLIGISRRRWETFVYLH